MAEVLEELARAYAGGITSFNAFSVTNCYNLGQIKTGALGNAILGGIVGYNEEGEVTNCYYLDSIQSGVGYNSSDGSTVVSPVQCTLEEMKAQDTFTGFDFNTVWEIDSTADYPYPTLIENPYNSDEDKEDIVVLGYQIKNMADDDTMFAVRFSAEIYDTKAYDAVGFEIIELSTDKSFVDKINPCTTVYKSLCNYNGVDSEAPEKDGVWYVAVEIENIPRNLEGLEFEIKPYVIFAGTTERVYGEAKTAQLINY